MIRGSRKLANGRWGVNNQPEQSSVEHIIGLLPVKRIAMPTSNTLRLEMRRPLAFWEILILSRLKPGLSPRDISEDDVEFIFQWD